MTPKALTTSRRWPVISALGVVQIFAWGSSYYLLGVFAAPIAADTSWSLSWIVGGLSLGLFVAGIASPRLGVAIRKHGGKPILALSSLLLASGLVILATAPVQYAFFAGWVVIGLGMGAGLYDAAFATLGGIYGREARSAITSLTLWGGFASTACWPLSAFLIENIGWRWSCIAYAAIQIGVCLPLILFVLPGQKQIATTSTEPETPLRLSPSENRAYLIIMAITVMAGLAVTIVSVHLLTILQTRGLSMAEAVSLGALIGPAQVSARLIEMASGGRHHPIWTLAAAAGLSALGLILLATGLPFLGTAIFMYGAGNGIFSIARGALPLALFGADRYAPIMGRIARPSLMAQAVAPTIGAVLLTTIGNEFTLAFIALVAIVNLSLVSLLWRSLGPTIR
ncbi:MFS transporter [Paracoccus litorisediminis]|uniref:MFS transporter n=1 Tax=Paracoccus litorisediminis TaxID=2006130 RepID=UPI001B8BBF02|nr:MFS transporter [Paracoccus litorisediminis]